MQTRITAANVLAFLLAGAPMAIPLIMNRMSPGTLYAVTMVAVYAFHLAGQWLQAVQPSIRAQVTEKVLP